MKETTYGLIGFSVGGAIGSLIFGYFNHYSCGATFNSVFDTLFGIWAGYIIVRILNKDIK